MTAIALPASMGLPPPQAMTTSGSDRRARAEPSRTRSIVGSVGTRNISFPIPSDASRSSIWLARPASAPVTMNTFRPNSAALWPTSWMLPEPKIIRAAVVKVKATFLPPARVLGVDIPVRFPGSGFGEHVSYCLDPCRVMRRRFMPVDILLGPIDFDQGELGRLILVLDDVESSDPWFEDALPGIRQRGVCESIESLGFDPNVYVDNVHARLPERIDPIVTRRRAEWL